MAFLTKENEIAMLARVQGTAEMRTLRSRRFSNVSGVLALAAIVAAVCLLPLSECRAARIKDIANISGVRPNILIGYGLVVGLNRTGDKTNTIFTNQSLSNMLEKMGVIVDPKATKVNNVAAVMVTAEMPPFAKAGNRVDVTVSSLGDATSLEGGVLLMTPLKGGNGQTFAVAQGPLTLGGYSAGGQAASVQKNHPTVGRIPNGAIVEQEIAYESIGDSIRISMKRPDFTNVRKVVDRINGTFRGTATADDGGTVVVSVPENMRDNPVKFLSVVENLEIKPENFAKIVVDEKTGTIVIGEDVRIDTIAVSHGNVTVQIKEDQKVSQPLPFSQGRTVVTPDTQMRVEEEKGHFVYMEGGVKIRQLVDALNAVGLSSRDMITILRTIKAAGALHADLEVI
jgi:flagellar P-ring protein precursor FlgI